LVNFSDELSSIASLVKNVLSDGGKLEVCQRLTQGIFYIYGMGVEGDVVEFGTMTGKTAVALSAAISICSRDLAYSDTMHGFNRARCLYLFDSFEGLPVASRDEDKSSPHVLSGVWGRGGCKGLSAEGLLEVCSKFLDISRIKVVKGWFKDTVDSNLSSPLALIHIDGDLYESAIDALDPLFAKGLVSKGAIIFFDDWNCNRSDPSFGERRAWSDLVDKYSIDFSDEGGYGIVSHKFIVHGYSSMLAKMPVDVFVNPTILP
jgi:hypothetical protein